MYDQGSFDVNEGSILGGMAAAIERFREHERMSYHCVSIAMECLSKKNFSGTAVEYCGRVLGTPISPFCADGSGGIFLFARGCGTVDACFECCHAIYSTITR
jgi:hypothetical protein